MFKKICLLFFQFRQDMAHFDFRHGQKWRILTFSIKAKFLSIINKWLLSNKKKSKLFIFDHFNCQNGPYLDETKKCPSKFLYVVQYMAKYQKINRKLKKYWGKIDSFLPWTQILKWTLRPLFCTQVKSSCVL